MFALFRSRPDLYNFQSLKTDIHTHLLPGVDNGPSDLASALLMVKGLAESGFSRLFCTPHIKKSLPDNTSGKLRSVMDDFRRGLATAGIEVEVLLAAEYLLDEGFEAKLESGDLLLLPGNRLLIELQPNRPEFDLRTLLFNLRIKEYIPLVAHPERYQFMPNYNKVLSKWHERGYELQVDILSLTGYHGPAVRETAIWLLKNDMITHLASNVHNQRELELLKKSIGNSRVRDAVWKVAERGGNLA